MKRWYAIGPVVTVDDPVEGSYQCAPEGCVGWIDTRPVTGEVASGFFAFDVRPEHLKETHAIIGDGTRLEEYYPSLAERSAWASAYAVTVNPTDTLLQMLVSLLTEQADPDGYERCRPLTVDHRGNYEIHLGGHSRIYRAKFRGEQDRLWPNLQRLWQAELSKTHAAEAKRGVDPDVQAGKMLAELARLHRCPVAELTPKELKGLKPRKPTTRYEDHFDYPDGPLAALVEWGVFVGPAEAGAVVSNQLVVSYTGSSAFLANYLHDLSSANQATSIFHAAGRTDITSANVQVLARATAATATCYVFLRRTFVRFQKIVGGTTTDLWTTAASIVIPSTVELTVDGSTLSGNYAGTGYGPITDTAISGGLRCGLGSWMGERGEVYALDDFVARDLLTASIPPFLLNMRAV